jgi:uncharacterized membrane protein
MRIFDRGSEEIAMRFVLASICIVGLTASGADAQQVTSLRCVGVEPFWSVTITAKAMWFTDHDDKRFDLALVKPRNAVGRMPDTLRVYQTRRVKDGAAVTLVVKRNYQKCTDNMSDGEFAYDAIYVTPEGVFDGCCSWAK